MQDIVLTQPRLIFYKLKNVESKKTYFTRVNTSKREEKKQKQDKTSFTERKIFKAML